MPQDYYLHTACGPQSRIHWPMYCSGIGKRVEICKSVNTFLKLRPIDLINYNYD